MEWTLVVSWAFAQWFLNQLGAVSGDFNGEQSTRKLSPFVDARAEPYAVYPHITWACEQADITLSRM